MQSGDTAKRAEMHDAAPAGSGRNPRDARDGVSRLPARKDKCPMNSQMMEAVVERENMNSALRRVEANKGSAGVDGMPVESLRPYLKEQWPRIKEALLNGQYKPEAVRRVNIPKPDGKGMRQLGIPTVIDRLIQQALHQVMQLVFDGTFSESSYGFRPGRSVHQAVLAARKHVESGCRWVVDMDLDGWIRRKLRCILWRQWKRTYARFKNLMKRGLDKVRAWKSATNGRGVWWNSGASHMNACFPKSYFDKHGLVSLLNRVKSLNTI